MNTKQHIGKSGRNPGDFGYEFDCDLEDCTYAYHPLDSRHPDSDGRLEIVPPKGKVAHLGIGRVIQKAPKMIKVLEKIAASSDEPKTAQQLVLEYRELARSVLNDTKE